MLDTLTTIWLPYMAITRLRRMRPAIQTLLLLIVIAGCLFASLVYIIYRGARYVFENRRPIKEAFSVSSAVMSDLSEVKTIYCNVKDVVARNNTLTQYVTFTTPTKNGDMQDITNTMKFICPDIKYYKGKSKKYKGTIVLEDYDIIRLTKKLGNTKLIQMED